MKKFVILSLFIVLVSSIPAFCTGGQDETETEWIKVSENNYIDSDGIVGTEDIYGFTFLLKSYNKGQYEPVNGHPVLYTLSQYTIDCGKKTYKIGVIDSYGPHDNFVNGDYNKYAKFQPIVSGTAVGEVFQKLCRE